MATWLTRRLNSVKIWAGRFTVRIEFKPQDCWVGVYWEGTVNNYRTLDSKNEWWVCIIPCFPIHIIYTKPYRDYFARH